MNKAWFFGCSFTSGVGYNFEEYLDPESDYFKENLDLKNESVWESTPFLNWCKEWKTKHQYDIWPYLVSKELKIECVNKGEGGSSNSRILHKIIRNLKNFNKGDFVFIGFTHPTRILVPTNLNYPKMSTLILESNTPGKSAMGKSDVKLIGSHPNLNPEQQYVLIDYLYHIIHEFSDNIQEYDYTTVVELVNYLEHVGIKPFLWDYSHWSYYENIDTYTKGRVQDGHWSINGHREFSRTVIKALAKNISILTPRTVVNKHFRLTKNII